MVVCRLSLANGEWNDCFGTPDQDKGPIAAIDYRPTTKKAPILLQAEWGTLVGTTGFEPATFPTPRECATRLRHVPIETLFNPTIFPIPEVVSLTPEETYVGPGRREEGGLSVYPY